MRVALQIENVVIQAGACTLTLIPALGGKLSSLRIGSRELLQTPLNPYAPRTHTMAFSEGDASGWDECLPSVAECVVQAQAGPAFIPDHGDLWRIPWEVVSSSSDSATLRAACFSLPLELTRTAILRETTTGWRLSLLYTIANLGPEPIPWAWTAHPLFATDPGDRILLPASVTELRVEGSGANRLGISGSAIPWPVVTLADGSPDDLSVAKSAATGQGDKLFTGKIENAADGWCVLERPIAGMRLTVRFDPAATPYLGLWLCYGGWPGGEGKKQVCVAPEPATAPVDSLAIPGPWARTLAPDATFSWPMELEIDRIELHNEANHP
jgi:galactose mutarotase-like enzyme